MLDGFVDRIPYDAEDNWVTHVAGHPPGALLFFVGLVRLGLGGDREAGLVVTALAASTAVRRAGDAAGPGCRGAGAVGAPFLVLTPAAVFMAVSADAMFAAVAAWGLAALALAATSAARGRLIAWSILAGCCSAAACCCPTGCRCSACSRSPCCGRRDRGCRCR